MFDCNTVSKVKNLIKKIIVYSPEHCPFRYTAPYYDGEEDYCNLKQSTFNKSGIIFTTCCCTDERWIEGCPLFE